MQEGTVIDYRLRLFGVPLRWQAYISRWQPPIEFVDEQLRGPYGLWIHTHSFHECDIATIIDDVVRYRLPFGPVGEVFHLLVWLQLKRIIRFRQQTVRTCLLAGAGDEGLPIY